MITELEMKEWLDGWFFSIDFRTGGVISTAVNKGFIPDHKPRWFDFDEDDGPRVNGNVHKWTVEQDDFIIERREAGDTFGVIASQIGISDTAVLKRYKIVCTQRGIKKMPRNHGRPRKHSEEVENAVVTARLAGKSFNDIAILVRLSRNAVYEIYRTYRTRMDKQRHLERRAAA